MRVDGACPQVSSPFQNSDIWLGRRRCLGRTCWGRGVKRESNSYHGWVEGRQASWWRWCFKQEKRDGEERDGAEAGFIPPSIL